MNTYFIRHTATMDVDDQTRARLWEERRIAIHFSDDKDGQLGTSDSTSVDPNDYKGSAHINLTKLAELASQGGYVCSQHHPYNEWMLGFVNPASPIELFQGAWGDVNECGGRIAILKTVRLDKVIMVNPLDYAVLQAGRPRQGAVNRWPSAKNAIENIVERKRSKPTLQSLSPPQQEILCSEFLRLPQAESQGLPRLAHLALPTGSTMRDIDIVGIASDGKTLLAQVTFALLSNAGWKLDHLRPYNEPTRSHVILFCDCQQSKSVDGITIFPIQKAFEDFTATPSGKAWLDKWT